jgi:protoheme ferro-lyase
MSQSETPMTLTSGQIQIASLISKRVHELAESGLDDLTLFGEMAQYSTTSSKSSTPRRPAKTGMNRMSQWQL